MCREQCHFSVSFSLAELQTALEGPQQCPAQGVLTALNSCEEGLSLLDVANSDTLPLPRGVTAAADCSAADTSVWAVTLLMLVLLLQTLIFLGKSHQHLKDSWGIPTPVTHQSSGSCLAQPSCPWAGVV